MKKLMLFLLLFLFLAVNASQTKVYWEPTKPKVGDKITVYAEMEGNFSSIMLKYCPNPSSPDVCFFEDMKKVDGKWVASFNADYEGKIEIAIIADGNVLYDGYIEVTKEKKTPGFEFALLAIAIAIIAKIKIKK